MEIELEPRVKSLLYKVKGMSRESTSQKAAHVLDTDLRSHWSTGTNTKEWIVLELDEPCLLSHIRIYNKSVLEWEISVGLSYKPETFVKVRPRCEAPRRDMIYPMNYTPCRYVRISCLRGNPIAIFFIQLLGVSVAGLSPEFQPVVTHLLPHIISQKQDAHDMHLQLLQDMTNRLLVFLPQLEVDLTGFSDAAESNLRFLAMLSGPFYPILHIVKERETAKSSGTISDTEVSKSSQSSSALTVSSNFEPRRSRGSSSPVLTTFSSLAFRPDVIFVLLRKAYKDSNLGTICKKASRVLQNLMQPVTEQEAPSSYAEDPYVQDETSKSEVTDPAPMVDYSTLFGEEFQIPDDVWDSSILNILDIGAVEEGILHVLYACASQPFLCSKLAESTCDFWSALPLVQALLPALRPSMSNSSDHIDDNFSPWKQPFVQRALTQIVVTSSSSLYRPLLHACSGYLSSFSPSHAKAACVLIDLCSDVLAPWIAQVVAKVDLIVELVEDLLGTIQGFSHSKARARAAIKYIVLALSGNMDDLLGKYKEGKHKLLFLLEMLEPFLHPAVYGPKSTMLIDDAYCTLSEKQKQDCVTALNIIRTAVQKSAVLPSLESEWRLGSVTPSVLLSILDPHMELPPEIDLCKSSMSNTFKEEFSSKLNSQDVSDVKTDTQELAVKMDVYEDSSSFFAPQDLQSMALTKLSSGLNKNISASNNTDASSDEKHVTYKVPTGCFPKSLVLDAGFAAEYFNLQADYLQLMNFRDCELRASEFRRLASDLHSQYEHSAEGHDAAIDALLLAAECYVNPFFVISSSENSNVLNQMKVSGAIVPRTNEILKLRRDSRKNRCNLETVADLEKKRDKIVLQLLLDAAVLDLKYQQQSDTDRDPNNSEAFDEQIIKLSPLDMQLADAVTLVRQNQALLCKFLIKRLQKQQQSMHEILMHCLVFFLHSATKLYCAPELVIDIILRSADCLTRMLSSIYDNLKEGILQLSPEKVHGVQRRWMLLQKLVIASSAGDNASNFAPDRNSSLQHGNLIPPSVWMQKVSMFSGCEAPLVRFLGWMAVSRNAIDFIKNRVFLVSDLSQLTYLLSVFADELALVDNIVDRKEGDLKIEQSKGEQSSSGKGFEHAAQQHGDQSFCVIYPYLSKFFPNMRKQFESFGETILEAVGLQLRSLPSSVVPDILCWFSDLCLWPFLQKDQIVARNSSNLMKGFVARNAKAVILYVLEAIVIEHMEALVPEMPRVVQVLVSLCRSSYCDVSFLDSILHILKPIISYSLCKVPDEEELLVDDSCLNFESLCFNELFICITKKRENVDISVDKVFNRALIMFILASVFPYLSFQRRREMLQSLILWTDFTVYEPTTTFHDYLLAYLRVMEGCKALLLNTLRVHGLFPLQSPLSDMSTSELSDKSSISLSWFFDNTSHSSYPTNTFERFESEKCSSDTSYQKNCYLSVNEIEGFTKDLEALISKLYPTIELCWNLHLQLAKNLTIISAQCLMYSRCLSSAAPAIQNDKEDDTAGSFPFESADQFQVHWKAGLKGLAAIILMLLENRCWEVSSLLLDCLLGVPRRFQLDNVIDIICSAIQNFSCSAPKVAWRLQSDKWLSVLVARGIGSERAFKTPLVDLFCSMLGHPEPEQRFIALQHLGKVVGQDVDGELVIKYSKYCCKLVSPSIDSSVAEPIISLLVSSSWDRVVVLASSDASLSLRIRAMILLVDFIPYAERQQLQSLLMSSDSVLHGFGADHVGEGPLLQLSLALLAGGCLHSPAEDISLIPQSVWNNIETLGLPETGGKVGDLVKKACQALCRLRNEGEEAKEVLKEVLSSNSSKPLDPDFGSTRESILQVLANLTSVQSYLDMFSSKIDEENMELEEAEMELDIVQKEHSMQETSKDSSEGHQGPLLAAHGGHDSRLQQIKDSIYSMEKIRLREDIVALRQKKLLLRRARQKHREEAVVREAELLQQLDRERTAELEKEIERQRLLEHERAKTRELRHNLDVEKERQTQRELQRELEQAESGLRPSRRDFSSGHSSRSRDRFRERDNGKASAEGTTRSSGGSSLQPEISSSSSAMMSMPTIVLSGSRSFSGQTPTILQSRDRSDDCGSSYEENFDGSKDSGDTGSVGDPELMSAFDGQSGGGFSSGQRHGSRGSKSRQAAERREREGRREGKWERKH